MAREIRTTKMLLDKRTEKLKELNFKEAELKQKNEILRKETELLAKENTNLNERTISLENKIKDLEEISETLEKDIQFYFKDIFELKQLKEEEIKSISRLYSNLDNKILESEEKLEKINQNSIVLHQKCVEEQKIIESQKRDLEIYRNRLQKKYDEVGLEKLILKE